MKKNLFDQHMMTVIVSGKTRRWIEDMLDEYKKDHPSCESMTAGTCAAILLEYMCKTYEESGNWRDKR